MPSTFDELQARRKPREKSITVVVDDGVMSERIEELERLLPFQRHVDETENKPPRAAQLQAELDDLKAKATQLGETFTFRELSRPVYRQLIEANGSTDRGLRWDEDTFAPALLAKSCVSHDFTEEQWKEIWDTWGAWATAPLFATAYEVCEQPSRVPFTLRSSAETHGSGQNSATAPHEG